MMTIIHREPIDLPQDFSWERFSVLPEMLKDEMANVLSLMCNRAIRAGLATVQRRFLSWPTGQDLSWQTHEEQRVVEFFWISTRGR